MSEQLPKFLAVHFDGDHLEHAELAANAEQSIGLAVPRPLCRLGCVSECNTYFAIRHVCILP
jgi:hypothetical protein